MIRILKTFVQMYGIYYTKTGTFIMNKYVNKDCMYACMHVCICVCVCVYTETTRVGQG
jgi:hypothetical protein